MKSFVKKIREIYDGWFNILTDNDSIKPLAEKRASICASCPHNLNNICSGKVKSQVVIDFNYNGEDRKKGDVVRGCSCPLSQKTASPNSQCPTGRWENLK